MHTDQNNETDIGFSVKHNIKCISHTIPPMDTRGRRRDISSKCWSHKKRSKEEIQLEKQTKSLSSYNLSNFSWLCFNLNQSWNTKRETTKKTNHQNIKNWDEVDNPNYASSGHVHCRMDSPAWVKNESKYEKWSSKNNKVPCGCMVSPRILLPHKISERLSKMKENIRDVVKK